MGELAAFISSPKNRDRHYILKSVCPYFVLFISSHLLKQDIATPAYHRKQKTEEALAKLPVPNACHSERSEESSVFKVLISFTSFRMTKKLILQEAQKTENRKQIPPLHSPLNTGGLFSKNAFCPSI